MDIDRARYFLEKLGCEKFNVSEQDTSDGHRTLLRTNCPLAKFLHDKQEDRHPSFALIQNNLGHLKYYCMACDSDGTITELIWKVISEVKKTGNQDERLKKNLAALANEVKDLTLEQDLLEAEDRIINFHVHKRKDDITKIKENFACLSDEVVARLKDMQAALWGYPFALSYLTGSRKITLETIKEYGLGWASKAGRIIVPQYDTDNRLVNIGGRYLPSACDGKDYSPNKWFHTKGFRREAFLYGEDRITQKDGHATVFLVEGMFDAIYLLQKGIPNVMALLGKDMTHLQAKKVSAWADKVVIVMDGDSKGKEAAPKIKRQLSVKEPIIHTIQDSKDPDELNDYQIEKIKTQYL